MRRLLALVACSALVAPVFACDTHTVSSPPPPSPSSGPAASSTVDPFSHPLVLDLDGIESGVDVPFDVPADALGFNIVIEGTVADFDADKPYGIERLVDPNGKIAHDKFMPAGGTAVTSTATFDTLAAVSIPQGEATAATPGTWKMRVGVQNDPTKKVKVTARVRIQSSGDGASHGGRLDLHVHVPDGIKFGPTTLTAAQAKDSPEVKQRVAAYFALLSQLLEIEQGDVVIDAADPAMASVDGSDELLEAFASSRGMADGTQAMHMLFTNAISLDGKPIASGISPGIPGAAGMFGRGVSTIVIATSPSADSDALTMVHETGHFFGLNHTTEFASAGADPLSDTPRCTDLTADPSSSQIFAQMKACPDRTNIMFPATAIETPATLSTEQKAVYHGSPIYKAFTSGTLKTQSLSIANVEPVQTLTMRPLFRFSNGPLSPLEQELSLGFCGLNKLDPEGIVRRHGPDAIAQLRAAEADEDLSPIIRGRAGLALDRLNAR